MNGMKLDVGESRTLDFQLGPAGSVTGVEVAASGR